jgi:hypothetical protein
MELILGLIFFATTLRRLPTWLITTVYIYLSILQR